MGDRRWPGGAWHASAGLALLLLLLAQQLPAGSAQGAGGTVGISAPAPAPMLPLSSAGAPQPGTAATAAGASSYPTEHRVVCTSDFPPMSTCNAVDDPASFTGYDVGLFRQAAARVGWSESTGSSQDNTYEFLCMDFTAMVNELADPNGTCDMAVAGITISTERMDRGIQFSYPTYRSSLAVMVSVKPASVDGWFFMKPFTWQVWLAIALTVFSVPVVTFVLEFLSVEGRVRRRDVVPGMKEASWRAMWTMMLLEPYQVTAISPRIIAILYGFLATVLVNTYCANLAAALTVSQLASAINSVDDLRGKAVGTVPVYMPSLAKYGIAATELPFAGISSANTSWVPQLRSGVLLATAVDEPVQQYIAATMGCDLQLTFNFNPFDFGMAFRKGTNDSLVSRFSDIILRLQEDGTMEDLRSTFIAIPRPECPDEASSSRSDNTSITFSQVTGLWVILACGVGLAALWLLGKMLYERRQRLMAAQRAAAGQPSLEQRRSPHFGNAFRQTVSIWGAQIGSIRRKQAEEAAANALAAAASQEGKPADGGAPVKEGSASASGGTGMHDAAAGDDPALPQFLAQIRQLCDFLEQQDQLSYVTSTGQRVVDDRIEEIYTERPPAAGAV